MISIRSDQYSSDCFNYETTDEVIADKTTEELVDSLSKILGMTFKGFVLTVVDEDDRQYSTTNLGTVEALKAIDGVLDVLEEDLEANG